MLYFVSENTRHLVLKTFSQKLFGLWKCILTQFQVISVTVVCNRRARAIYLDSHEALYNCDVWSSQLHPCSVSIVQPFKPLIPDKISAIKSRDCCGMWHLEVVLEVPPALIYARAAPSLTLMPRNMQGHLKASAHGGRPSLGPASPTDQQNLRHLSVAGGFADYNSGPRQLLCGTFNSPCFSLSYFRGGNFSDHVALQVHVV